MFFHHIRALEGRVLTCIAILICCTFSFNSFAQIVKEPVQSVSQTQAPARVATDDLDPAFAPVIDFAYGSAMAVEIQADGKVLVGGLFKSMNGHAASGLMRWNADRTVDTSFIPSVRGNVTSIAIQPDAKIVIAGSFTAVNGIKRNSVARLNVDGSLDTSFDPGSGPSAIVRDVALQTDGKV